MVAKWSTFRDDGFLNVKTLQTQLDCRGYEILKVSSNYAHSVANVSPPVRLEL